ncbi:MULTISPECIES: metalloprotease PmbA [Methylococcus]|uniref:Metalloprotease subunit TldE n=1 Tax=Methylococcus capsulatus TaxID=414 RepID=A0AA35UPI4_METCP|nr:metalloprotease PmbA [Methylococcus capsulatus]CAI8769189.1 metalloprotease subunit TldE [Methylococcus capsulatus]
MSDTRTELERLESLTRLCLDEAARQGASAAEVACSADQGLSLTVRLGAVETIEHHRSQGVGITVYYGQRKGSASTTDLSERALTDTVGAACRIARYGAEDPCAGLPEAELLAKDIPDLDLYHPWTLDAEQGIELALACENAARSHSDAITNSEGASLNAFEGVRVLGNSLGFLHGYASSRHSLSCSVIGERDGNMQRDDWWTVARDPAELESVEAVGRKAAERTVRRLGARGLSTRQCPVLFAADVASSLIGHLIAAIRGGNLYRKSSFLLDALGQRIFPEFVHIHERPHLRRGLGSAPYDAEGVATRDRDLVRDGVLESYVLSTYSARKLGLQTTGNAGGVHNLIVAPGQEDCDTLIRRMGTGLIVTELLGQGVNIVTGDYSRGAAGYWVENGEIRFPVEEITIAGNLRDMFGHVVAIGNDVDLRGNIRTGSILIESMTVAGD